MSKFLDSDDEFGYDLSVEDEQALLQLSSNPPGSRQAVKDPNAVIDSVPSRTATIPSGASVARPNTRHVQPQTNQAAAATSSSELPPERLVPAQALPSPVSLDEDVTYPDLSQALANLERDLAAAPDDREVIAAKTATTATTATSVSLNALHWDTFDDDGRSPLQRFRSYPRRPLTVSDLTAGAWCELQYWYTLTRLPGGRRTKTAAMKQGSKIHKDLEDEVHTTVKIEVLTKEDAFGLRLWNLIQGLRTLRETGLTRELEVWGVVEGNLVNGVIDKVSHENPNEEFENELSSQESQVDHRQARVTDYFPSSQKRPSGSQQPKAYLSDVKTRGSRAPISKTLLRPAITQLLLYHQFLSAMAADRLEWTMLFRRYGLDADDTFSDAFMAQIGGLHDDIFVDAPTSSDPEPRSSGQTESSLVSVGYEDESQDLPDILNYKSLRELVYLVRQEMSLTFPDGEDSIGPMLRVQYVSRQDGSHIDVHDFPASKQALSSYLDKYMPWWQGDREAEGVSIEEAFKCRTCEFAADCTWRQRMHDERVRSAEERVRARRGKST